MQTVEDFLLPFRAKNDMVFENDAARQKYETFLFSLSPYAQWLKQQNVDSPVGFFNRLWREYQGGDFDDTEINPSPDGIMAACRAYGIAYVDQFNQIHRQPVIPEYVNKCLNSTKIDIDEAKLKKITFEVCINAIKASLNVIDNPRLEQEDNEYYSVDEQYAIELLEKSPTKKYQYIPEKCDCDDFTRILRGWFSQNAKGNIAAFVVKMEMLDYDNQPLKPIRIAHAMIAVITHDENGNISAKLFEPQSNSWKPRNYTIVPNAATNVIYDILG